MKHRIVQVLTLRCFCGRRGSYRVVFAVDGSDQRAGDMAADAVFCRRCADHEARLWNAGSDNE